MSGHAVDLSALHGPQGLTDEDRAYEGSRYADVKAALLENPYQPVWGGEGGEGWPVYRQTISNAFAGVFPGGRPGQLRAAALRAVDSRADLRWGEDRKGYRRILHPNGVCLFGTWEITEDNPYSGYFRPGSRGLIISRFSPAAEVRRGRTTSFALVGKIYPTADENHPDPLFPAHFFTQQDLGGERIPAINDAVLRNVPNVTLHRKGLQFVVLVLSNVIFESADRVADARQLHEVAELGKPEDQPTNAPEHMVLRMSPGQPRIEGETLDFRDEIYAHIFDRGDPEPKRSLSFDVAVSNEARVRGLSAFKRVEIRNPQLIGRITFNHAVASYNGDHVIHFPHPHWRDDRNDPSTAVRVDGRRVRR